VLEERRTGRLMLRRIESIGNSRTLGGRRPCRGKPYRLLWIGHLGRWEGAPARRPGNRPGGSLL